MLKFNQIIIIIIIMMVFHVVFMNMTNVIYVNFVK